MEQITKALELARKASDNRAQRQGSARPRQHSELPASRADTITDPAVEIELNGRHLEARRIIAHDLSDPRAKSFDMLRTQVLPLMDSRNWQFLAVTSPTPGCGKTVTATNLAISIARQPERSVLLVDMDLQKPQILSCLGVTWENGLLGALAGRIPLSDAMFRARIGSNRFMVLPTESSTRNSSEWMTSNAMSTLLKDIKRDFRSRIVIFDMPPMLSSDDVLAVLPQLDCILLVAAVGVSTVSEIDECNSHLQSADVVRLVLNKATETSSQYYY